MEHEYGEYAKIVEQVKTAFAKKSRAYAGDEVSHEIAKRWAKHCGRKPESGKPATPAEVPASTEAPTAEPVATGSSAVEERKLGQAMRINLPDTGEAEDED